MFSSLPSYFSRPGQVNFPSSTADSRRTAEELILQDAEAHHCYFRSSGFHNHLSHHLLAAYDLGATSAHLRKIYQEQQTGQRPIVLEERDRSIVVNDDNWAQYLGNQSAYGAFVAFFVTKVKELGATAALERYVFDESVNTDDKLMLVRFVSGVIHPLIQVGHGAEFGSDILLATGLAQTAVHNPTAKELYRLDFTPEGGASRPPGATVLELLQRVYESPTLHPAMPYDPDALLSARLRPIIENNSEEIAEMCYSFQISSPEDIPSRIEELVWASTLLLAGTGRAGRKLRLDFFLMHLVTSSLFLRPIVDILRNPMHKANLLRAFMTSLVMVCLVRGRPRINPRLLMSYPATARPPSANGTSLPSKTSLGCPTTDADYNPWPLMLSSVIYHPEAHVVKTFRSLLVASKLYGATPTGAATGSFSGEPRTETHEGTRKMDGSVFVRAAGMVLDYMGWVAYGQEGRKDWDYSALGWEAAWDNEDD